MMLRISAYPLSIPAKIRAQVWQMTDVALIQSAGHAVVRFWQKSENSNLERAVLEEFAKRFERLKEALK